MEPAPITDFLKYLEHEKKFSPHTVQSYSTDLLQLNDYIQREISQADLLTVTHFQIRSWMASLLDQGLSARTVNRKLSTLKSFYKYLLRNKRISRSPLQKITGPKNPKRLPVFVDEGQMESLPEKAHFEESFEGRRDQLIMELFYQTGIRRAELIGLKELDVDLYNLSIRVLGKRNKERIIPISLELKRNLEAYLEVKRKQGSDSTFLFTGKKKPQMSPQEVYKTVIRYLSQITSPGKKSPHVLRHTFATHLLNNGADINAVKELLGHANLAATQVYTHNTIDKLKKTYKQAHPRSGE